MASSRTGSKRNSTSVKPGLDACENRSARFPALELVAAANALNWWGRAGVGSPDHQTLRRLCIKSERAKEVMGAGTGEGADYLLPPEIVEAEYRTIHASIKRVAPRLIYKHNADLVNAQCTYADDRIELARPLFMSSKDKRYTLSLTRVNCEKPSDLAHRLTATTFGMGEQTVMKYLAKASPERTPPMTEPSGLSLFLVAAFMYEVRRAAPVETRLMRLLDAMSAEKYDPRAVYHLTHYASSKFYDDAKASMPDTILDWSDVEKAIAIAGSARGFIRCHDSNR